MYEFVLLETGIIVSSVRYLQPAQVYTSAVYGGSVIVLNMPYELVDLLGFLTSDVFKYNTLHFRSKFSPCLKTCSFHCHYVMIIYTVIKHRLTSN